jgi:hypothetical protein
MAGSLLLNVEILGEFRKLTAATQGATKTLTGMQKSAQKVSSNIKKAFLTIGVGLSFAAIAKGFKESTQAAQQDVKGRELLTIAIQNNTKATQDQIDEVDNYIERTEVAAAVSDDILRPALGSLVRATGSTTRAMELLDVALDVSAGTGKDLGTVSEAMSKALGGNVGALRRLIPTLNNTEDPMVQLARAFKGANAEAAKGKTWERFEIIMGNIQEMIGMVLLPVLEKFSAWFTETYPKVQDFFEKVAEALANPEVKKAMKELGDAFGNLGRSLSELFGIPQEPGAKSFAAFFTGIADTMRFIVNSVDFVLKVLKNLPYLNVVTNLIDSMTALLTRLVSAGISQTVPANPGRSNDPRSQGGVTNNTTINVNNGNVTAQQIANAINRGNRATGTSLIRAN